MANEEVRINLTSSADTSGVDKMGAAVGGISGGAEKAAAGLGAASKSSKELGSALGKSVEVGGAATSLMTNLSAASQGGASGFFAAGRAILSFGQIVKGVLLGAGPVGIAVAAIGLLAGAVFALKDAFKPAGESAEEMAKRIAELNKAKLDRVAQEQKALTEATNDAVAAINTELTAMDKLADMKTARLIEEEKARGKEQGLPAEVTERNITRIRRDAEDAKIGRELSAADKTARVLEDAAGEAEQKRLMADVQRNQLLGIKATYDQLNEQEAAMRKEMLKGYLKRGYALPEQNEQLASLQKERDAARARLEKRLGGRDADGELYKDAQKTADETLRTTTEAAQAAARAAEKAAAVAADARQLEGEVKPERDKLRAAENRNARVLTDDEKAKIAADRAKAQAAMEFKMRELGHTVVANRIAGGDKSLDPELASTLFPGRKFALRSTTSAAPASPFAGQNTVTFGQLPAAQPGAGNTVTFGALSTSQVDPRNQVTRGQLQPGSDNKVAQALDGTTAAVKSQDTGDDAAKAAEQLQKTTEEHAKAVATNAQKTDAAMGSATKALGAAAKVMQDQNLKLGQHDGEFRRVWAAISAIRASKGT